MDPTRNRKPSEYAPISGDAERQDKARTFLKQLEKTEFRWERGTTKGSGRGLGRFGIGSDNVAKITKAEVALPPRRFGAMLDSLDYRQYEAGIALRHLYLDAYEGLYENDPDQRAALDAIRRKNLILGRDVAEALGTVSRVTQRNIRDANSLLATGPDQAHHLQLADLYVPRSLGPLTEAELLRRCDTPGVTVITGEPGVGKTSLLWHVASQLQYAGRPVEVLNAVDLSTAAVTPAQLAEKLNTVTEPLVPVLLVDTVDLLLRNMAVPDLLEEIFDLASAARAAVLMTCREREAGVLRQHGEFAVTFETLGPYDSRELKLAIRTHADHFLAGTGYDADQLAAKVESAHARGLPIAEICRRPLTLRMLFELALLDAQPSADPAGQPEALIQTEIDITDLFEQHWALRVVTDGRTNAPGQQETDASAVAEYLAVVMLAHGELRVDVAEAGIVWRDTRRAEHTLTEGLTALRRRHVIQGEHREVHYFHQIFFEYACARAIMRLPLDVLDQLVAQTCDDHDPFLGAVVQQTLVYACRSRLFARRVDPIFAKFLRATDEGAAAVAIATYAQARHRGPLTIRAARDLFAPPVDPARRGGVGLAKRYMDYLPRIRHDDTESVLEDLAVIWRWDSQNVRKAVFDALRTLALSFPEPVLRFLQSGRLDCFGWFLNLTGVDARILRNRPLALIEALAPADREWARQRLVDLATKVCEGTTTHDALASVLSTVAVTAGPEWDLKAFLSPAFLDIDTKTSGIEALNRALAGIFRKIWLVEDRPAGSLMEDILAGSETRLSRRARLWALAEIAHQCPPDVVEDLLNQVRLLSDPLLQADVCDYFIGRLLQGESRLPLPGAPVPVTGTSTKIARRHCAEAIRRLPLPAERDRNGCRHAAILWRDALDQARLSPPDVAALMDDVTRGRDARSAWTRSNALAAFTVSAAVGGHAGARQALERWSGRSSPLQGKESLQVRQIFTHRLKEFIRTHPETLGHLLSDAKVETDATSLAQFVNDTTTGDTPAPSDYAPAIADLAHLLLSSQRPQTRNAGYVLLRWAAGAGYPVPPALVLTGLRKERSIQALSSAFGLLENMLDDTAGVWADPRRFAAVEEVLVAHSVPGAAPSEELTQRAQDALRTLYCVAAPITAAASRRETIDRVRELTLLTGHTTTLGPLKSFLVRLAAVDSAAAAGLLIEASKTVHDLELQGTTDSWKTRRAHLWRPGILAVVAALDHGAWERMLRALAVLSPTIFGQVISVSMRHRTGPVEAVITQAVHDHPPGAQVLGEFESSKAKLRRITGNGRDWPQVLDSWLRQDGDGAAGRAPAIVTR